MIYDPHLTRLDSEGNCHNLAVESALAHPDVPMLLAWSPAEVPDFGSLRGYEPWRRTYMRLRRSPRPVATDP
jgi:hypothetical protein